MQFNCIFFPDIGSGDASVKIVGAKTQQNNKTNKQTVVINKKVVGVPRLCFSSGRLR